jgi:hypothetical protein
MLARRRARQRGLARAAGHAPRFVKTAIAFGSMLLFGVLVVLAVALTSNFVG